MFPLRPHDASPTPLPALFIGVTLTAEPLLLSWVSTATLCISIACALSGAFSPVLKARGVERPPSVLTTRRR